jgi:hypothetical protein
MATGVASWSTTAATNSSADSAVNWAEGQAPSSVNDSARAMMASVAKWRDDLSGAITTAGTSTAYTATTNPTFASLSALDNKIITIVPHATSGAAPTLAVDSLTAKAINISTGVAVPTGFLVAGTPYVVYYEAGVGEYIVLGTPGAFNAISGTTGTFSSTLTTGGSITATSSSITAGTHLVATTIVFAGNGTKTAPSYGFTSDADNGLYLVGANSPGMSAGDTKVQEWVTTGTTVTGTLTATGALSAASVTGSMVAAQADQETATSTATIVTPGRQQYHPSAAKCWLKCDHAGTVDFSYNITSITDTGTGAVTVTIATDFSGVNYSINATVGTAVGVCCPNSSQAVGSFVINAFNTGTGAAQDSILGYYAVCFGDQ